MSTLPILSADQALARFATTPKPYQASYFAFYSSALNAIVTDPALMLVPVDDHMVHRGDGVFETLKCIDGGLYVWREHVDRLFRSAERIGLRMPWTRDELADITVQTIRAGGRRDCLVRMLVSRGPGSLGISPYDCPEPGLYIVVYESKASFMEAHPRGARAVTSAIPVKPSFFAQIKTCNYLPNALLKKEAADAGVDFAVGFDEAGNLAEGATENAGIVTRAGILRVPRPDRILAGTTMHRAVALARTLIERNTLRGIDTADVPRTALVEAAEVLIFGTTPDVTSVIELDGRPIGDGRPGPVALALNALLQEDLRANAALRLPVFGAKAP